MTAKQLLDEASKLPAQERYELAEMLFESTEGEFEPEIDPELAAELDRVAKHADEHPETVVPHAEVMRQMLEIFAQKAPSC